MFEFRSIVCGAGITEDVDREALCHALKIALLGRAEVALAHADGDQVPTDLAAYREALREPLVRWGALTADQDLSDAPLRTAIVRVPGSPDRGLAHMVKQRRPDLLVLGTHQRSGMGRWVHPSVAEAIARVARVPTLFVPAGAGGIVSSVSGELRLGRVLIPVAFDPDPSLAVQLAQRLASTLGRTGIHYRTLHVGQRRDAPTLDRMRDDSVWNHVDRSGPVLESILAEADDFGADLVVMSTGGHDSLGDRLLGSTVERVVRAAGCPVLSAPPTLF